MRAHIFESVWKHVAFASRKERKTKQTMDEMRVCVVNKARGKTNKHVSETAVKHFELNYFRNFKTKTKQKTRINQTNRTHILFINRLFSSFVI